MVGWDEKLKKKFSPRKINSCKHKQDQKQVLIYSLPLQTHNALSRLRRHMSESFDPLDLLHRRLRAPVTVYRQTKH